ncbi:MAG: DUF302 domain-containing protein [Acidimicrobiales bacterium]
MHQDNESNSAPGVVAKSASGSVEENVTKLLALAESHGLHVFAVIDHSGEAHKKGLELRDTKVVIFGSPEAGTPVMQAAPLVALDLPLKVLIWDDHGTTNVAYTDPHALAARYDLSPELSKNLMGIGPLTDALVEH